MEFRSKKYVFLGHSLLHKGHKCLHVPTNRVYISRDVVFDEHVFPLAKLPVTTTEPPPMHSSSIASDQFDDAAYSSVLLPNHGAGTGRWARLELLDDIPVQPDAQPVESVVMWHLPCMIVLTMLSLVMLLLILSR
jgi:glyoxylase-like metal-dependent hydrolase (beta-lactamase superfamily II)